MHVSGGFHLTYCSNIHPGERWPDVSAALADALPRVRALAGHGGPMAVGLRLSAAAARELEEPGALAAFVDFLRTGGYYVPTINGFPYGAFHHQRVKEHVYLPDWRSPERLDYSNRLARILATLSKDTGLGGNVSTVPGGFKGHIGSEADVASMALGILRHAAFLKTLREETGAAIGLSLEPEPACLLETTRDVVSFFERHLLSPGAIAAVNGGADAALTPDDVRRHVGVCVDACHEAVAFEDPEAAFRRLADAGITVMKVQLSSALRIPRVDAASLAALQRFSEDTYLHQVVERNETGYVRFVDLPDALAAEQAAPAPAGPSREWRVHFHVPIFLSEMEAFGTTQPQLTALLGCLKRQPARPVLEVETYTWDVLPAEYRRGDMCTAIARELAWVRGVLEA